MAALGCVAADQPAILVLNPRRSDAPSEFICLGNQHPAVRAVYAWRLPKNLSKKAGKSDRFGENHEPG
jgi:hypothetical protein